MASVTSDPTGGEPAADMPSSASASNLTNTSYVVLGLVQLCQPSTAYELKAFADRSIGYFWDFPRSQIYAESNRLVGVGLLDEDQEQGGRRRRVLTLTEEGHEALAAWVATPDDDVGELRDRGLLKLFFSRAVGHDDVVELARHQRRAHERRLAEYEAIAAEFAGDARGDPTRVVLESGLRYEAMAVAYWTEVERDPPS